MTDSGIVVHASIAVGLVILLIIRVRVDPTISLILGSIYLGLAGGLGFAGTVEAITSGFGELMGELGLLIGLGVLLGSLLLALGVLQALVHRLLTACGERRFPYLLGLSLGTVFPSIIPDVQFVLVAPIVRSAAAEAGQRSLPRMITGMVAGSVVGLVLVVPGLGTLAIAGILEVQLSSMLVYGFVVGPLTVLVTILICTRLTARIWREGTDLDESDPGMLPETTTESESPTGSPSGRTMTQRTDLSTKPHTGSAVWTPLLVSVLVPVMLIAVGSIVQASTGELSGVLTLVCDPTFALLVGLLSIYVIARRRLGADAVEQEMSAGFKRCGNILLVTGAGGAFGTVIASTTLADTIGGRFSATASTATWAIVLIAWAIAAIAHLGVGSISVAAITAAGIVSPLIEATSVPSVLVALAIGAGAMFAIHINSNGFWLLRSLLGISTSGTLKTLTLVSSVASVVALGLVLALSVVVQ